MPQVPQHPFWMTASGGLHDLIVRDLALGSGVLDNQIEDGFHPSVLLCLVLLFFLFCFFLFCLFFFYFFGNFFFGFLFFFFFVGFLCFVFLYDGRSARSFPMARDNVAPLCLNASGG